MLFARPIPFGPKWNVCRCASQLLSMELLKECPSRRILLLKNDPDVILVARVISDQRNGTHNSNYCCFSSYHSSSDCGNWWPMLCHFRNPVTISVLLVVKTNFHPHGFLLNDGATPVMLVTIRMVTLPWKMLTT